MGCQDSGSLVGFFVIVFGGNVVPATAVILYSWISQMALNLLQLVLINIILKQSLALSGKRIDIFVL